MCNSTIEPVRLLIYPHPAIILVVCPLKSLVDSHLRELRNPGISAASLSSEDVDDMRTICSKELIPLYSEVPSPSYRTITKRNKFG